MHVEGAGVALAYEEDGDGPATVLVHGMGAPRPARGGLAGRVIAYDRRGYGWSGGSGQASRIASSRPARRSDSASVACGTKA